MNNYDEDTSRILNNVLLGVVTKGGGVAVVNRCANCVPTQGEPQNHIMVVVVGGG